MKRLLVDKMQRDHGMSAREASEAIDWVFTSLRGGLEDLGEGMIRVPGFGTFRRQFQDTRTVRNPATGEKTILAGRHVVKFREAKRR